MTLRVLLRLAGVPRSARLAVALSGGADSSALTLLAHEWASSPANTAPPILALQVDHDLRAESSAEVEHCAAWLAARSQPHLSPPLLQAPPPLLRLFAFLSHSL